jgi:hypothetical protein
MYKKLVFGAMLFPASFTCRWVLNKDPTVWLDGARPPKNTFASK